MPEISPTRFTMVPARRSSEPTARRRARRILAALFLAATLSVIAVGVSLAKGQANTDYSKVDPKGRDLAYTAAVNFLLGAQQNVPHAKSFAPDDAARASQPDPNVPPTALPYQSLSWTGFTPEHFGSAKSGTTDFEIHHFLVVLANPVGAPNSTAPTPPPRRTKSPGASAKPTAQPSGGVPSAPVPSTDPGSPSATPSATDSASPSPSAGPSESSGGTTNVTAPESNVLKLDVPVLISDQGPRLAAAPTFSVWTGGTGAAAGAGDYSNFSGLSVELTPEAKAQIAQWAKAYVTGDSAGLLTLTGDQNTAHRYLGLSGFTLPNQPDAVQVRSAIKASQSQLVVRVRVLLARAIPGGTVSSDGTTQQFTTFADYDLLVGAPSGAQPPILAWGPAGSAAELEPYSNALPS